MRAPVTASLPDGVQRNGAAREAFPRSVFTNVWLFMRLHVDLLRLASAMCRTA
ncbi:MAG: hypothetical protein M3186_06295 [Actinomycetota bacterium]|nr:hypothetical protein [Actinomycetota bacterium]